MLMLTVDNEVANTDTLTEEIHFGTLSFKNYNEPDFFFEKMAPYVEVFESASITLFIGKFEIVMPLHWSILCTDWETVQTIPLYEVSGREFQVFCLNPLSSFAPRFLTLKTGSIFPSTTWTTPSLADKDMLVVPLGEDDYTNGSEIDVGPICAMFAASKMEINKPIGDIW